MFQKNHKAQALSEQRKNTLVDFQKRLGVRFKDLTLLDAAFHHRSYANEAHNHGNNERLEFLGDSVLGLTVVSYLYDYLPDHAEGELAKIKSMVVSELILSEIALRIGLDKCLCLGRGEEHSGGRQKKPILADAMEAVFGAFYLDSGFNNAQELILSLLVPEIHKVIENKGHKDFKTILQEYVQKQYKKCPKYMLVKTTGPDHDHTFWISVDINGTVYGPVAGKSKKLAEQNLAEDVCDKLKLNQG